jgi:mono/diheme cytochrome c family protein
VLDAGCGRPAQSSNRHTRVIVRLLTLALFVCLVSVVVGASSGSRQAPVSVAPASVGPASSVASGHPAPEKAVPAEFDSLVRPFIADNCASCHNEKKNKGQLNLESYETRESMLRDPERWEEVVRKLRAGEMPPEDEPRPDPADVKAVTAWVEREIEAAEIDAARDPGRVTIRRLNRTEYNNTVRDLLGVDFRPADEFPQDDSGYGFDNIGDVLSLSPVLMERYLRAAERVARSAIFGPATMKPTLVRVNAGPRQIVERKEPLFEYDVSGLSLPNALHAMHTVPVEAEYRLRASLGGVRPAGSDPLTITLWLDGKEIQSQEIDPAEGAGFTAANDRQDLSGKVVNFTTRLPAGQHWIAITVPRLYEGLPVKYAGPNPAKRPMPPPEEFNPPPTASPERVERMRKAFEARRNEVVAAGESRVSYVEIAGPYEQTKGPSPASVDRVYVCGHKHGGHQAWCATKIISTLARRAFRRPVTAAELQRYTGLASTARRRGESFDEGLAVAVQALLVSPDFLFRIEKDRAAAAKDLGHPIGQHELASRLSYFLWASMPDDELIGYADKRMLRQPEVLEAQVRRMLKDPRARTIAEEFGGQWLQFRALESLTRDRERFPAFEDYLRFSMKRETELFFESLVREDRSVLDFLDGRYTYVNERLARHYGLPDVTGPEFRRVDLTGTRRGGVLTQASVLTVSSYATRTSPVLRGKWVLENILGTPPPDPPPDVPNLDDAGVGTATSIRKQLEAHRKNPTCASCHRRMDPLGFGLENFDAIGAWRTAEGTIPIDATGELPDGREFDGPDELKAILAQDRDAFTRCLTGKLLTYALGRGLERSDRRTVKTIAADVARQEYRFSSLVLGIVNSRPFRMRRAPSTSPRPQPVPTPTGSTPTRATPIRSTQSAGAPNP